MYAYMDKAFVLLYIIVLKETSLLCEFITSFLCAICQHTFIIRPRRLYIYIHIYTNEFMYIGVVFKVYKHNILYTWDIKYKFMHFSPSLHVQSLYVIDAILYSNTYTWMRAILYSSPAAAHNYNFYKKSY